MDRQLNVSVLLGFILGAGLLLLGMYSIPWKSHEWGSIETGVSRTVTVTGEGTSEVANQVAQFTAGVSIVNDNKDTAIQEVNSKMRTIIDEVKAFGIEEKDIKTQNLSVYQSDEQYYEEGRQKYRPGQWRVSNDIQITLRDASKASELADVLTRSGATNVYGPNFQLDDTVSVEDALLQSAIDDARTKAQTIANASGKTLGEILQVQEQVSGTYPLYMMERGGGGGGPVEPGTSTVQKLLTVTFELN